MNEALLGGISVGSFAVGLFFIRFWRSTRDRFFLYFAASFWIEAANRAVMAWLRTWNDDAPLHYLIRSLAYGLILWAIWDKNRMR